MSRKIMFLFGKVVSLVLFIAVSVLTLFFAYGYRIDFIKRDVRKTSIIDIQAKYQDVSISLDGIDEKTRKLPYQVKNVVPATHVLSIQKEGYKNWERKVKVREDFVSIVNDVLLMPLDPLKTVSLLKRFVPESQVAVFSKSMMVWEKGKNLVYMVLPSTDGVAEIREVKVPYKIDDLIFLNSSGVLISAEGKKVFADMVNGRYVELKIPANAFSIQLNFSHDTVYFLVDGDLYAVPFNIFAATEIDYFKYKIRSNVLAFTVAPNRLFLLINGTLYGSNLDGMELKLLDLSPGKYVNLAYFHGRSAGALVLRDRDEKRSLNYVDTFGNIENLESDLRGKPFMNLYDQLVYANNSGEIVYYDGVLKEKILVTVLADNFEIMGWLSDEGHFVIRVRNLLELHDVLNANTYIMLGDANQISNVLLNKGVLYYLKGSDLYSMNLLAPLAI